MARLLPVFNLFAILLLVGFPAGFEARQRKSNKGRPCKQRQFPESVVCVCNSDYCDDVIRTPPQSGGYVAYTSSQSGLRFHVTKGSLKKNSKRTASGHVSGQFNFGFHVSAGSSNQPSSSDSVPSLGNAMNKLGNMMEATIQLNQSAKYQTIEGFGGAVTDAAAINWQNLTDPALKQNLINSYFGKNGLEYNMIRTPIGGADFSTHPYAYNEYPEDDASLSNFTLTSEDFNYKIPMIKAAMAAATDDIHIVASAWSPPTWMKNPSRYTGLTLLLPEYYQTYADYYLKYIEAYAAHDISIWAVSTGNEPITSSAGGIINSLGWPIDQLGVWIGQNLGPTIQKSQYSDVKILACDDQRPFIPILVDQVIKSYPEADQYISGIAVHWYADQNTPSEILAETSKKYPDKFILATEASAGSMPMEEKVALGSWLRAVHYVTDIIQDLTKNVVGWIDWNLDLNMIGGPNWAMDFVDSSIIVFAEDQEFVKQPMYYAMGHFSKFVPRGSVRINSTIQALPGLEHVAFQTPQNTVVLVLYNAGLEQTVKINLDNQQASVKLAPASIVTVEMKS